MRIETLFEAYDASVSNRPNSNHIFHNSGMVNRRKVLDYGFFPLASGILADDRCEIANAYIEEKGVMVLGNDFGTVSYVTNKCKNKRETNSKTISNLLTLGLNLERTFFTNLFLGLRDDERHEGQGMTKRTIGLKQDYRDMCYDFFLTQLSVINPDTVICLGADVGHSLSTYSDVFKAFSKKNKISGLYSDEVRKDYVIQVNDNRFGNRRFILIPHPSYAHINWAKNNIKDKIIQAIKS